MEVPKKMASKESTFINMVICLFVICLLGSALLGGVYLFTTAPIASAQTQKTNNAIAAVVPKFDNDPGSEKQAITYKEKSYNIYPASKKGKIVGYAVEASTTKGFGGTIVLMVGFQPDGTIENIAVVSHAETPGLGDKMEASKSDFIKQFPGKNPRQFRLQVKQDGGDVDAITAATISSRAFCDATALAHEIFQQIQSKPIQATAK